MEIELRHLRAFAAVADQGHFTRAAQRLYVTQPALSKTIAQLERRLGVRLLERGAHRVTLTPAGQELLARARVILRSVEEATDATRAAARRLSGELRLGIAIDATHAVGARLDAFRGEHPSVSLRTYLGDDDTLLGDLRRDRLDCVIAWMAGSPEFASVTISREPVVAALPAGDALAQRHDLTLDHLRAEPLILFERDLANASYDALTRQIYDRADGGRTPVVAPMVESGQEAMLDLARRGQGWAPVTDRIFRLHPRPGLISKPLAVSAWIDIVHRRDAAPPTAALAHCLQLESEREPSGSALRRGLAGGGP